MEWIVPSPLCISLLLPSPFFVRDAQEVLLILDVEGEKGTASVPPRPPVSLTAPPKGGKEGDKACEQKES